MQPRAESWRSDDGSEVQTSRKEKLGRNLEEVLFSVGRGPLFIGEDPLYRVAAIYPVRALAAGFCDWPALD